VLSPSDIERMLSMSINVFENLWICDLTFSPSGDVNPHDILRGGLRSSHISGEGLSVISHVTAGTYVSIAYDERTPVEHRELFPDPNAHGAVSVIVPSPDFVFAPIERACDMKSTMAPIQLTSNS
jgi:hypothetical protein